MKHIHIQTEVNDAEDMSDLVIEGELDSLKLFSERLTKVVNGELDGISEVRFDDTEPKFVFKGQRVRIKVRKGDPGLIRKQFISKDVLIAAGVVVACIGIVVIALLKSGMKSSG